MTCYSGTLQSLINEGVVVLYHDYRSGTFLDWSGTGNDGIPTAPTELNGRGMRLNLTGRLDVAADASLNLGGYDSASIFTYWPDGLVPFTGAQNYIWTESATGGYFGFASGGLSVFIRINGVTSIAVVTSIFGDRALSYSWESGNGPLIYKNGVYESQSGTILTKRDPQVSTSVLIGTNSISTRQIPSTFGVVLATNRALTADEHHKIYKDLSR